MPGVYLGSFLDAIFVFVFINYLTDSTVFRIKLKKIEIKNKDI